MSRRLHTAPTSTPLRLGVISSSLLFAACITLRLGAISTSLLLAACAPGARATNAEGMSAGGLAYYISGRGPSVVLLHGSNLDSRMWMPQLAPFAARFRVIRYDQRAHGKSPDPTERYDSAQDLAALLDELEVRSASLVGLSNGARVAVDFALAYPDRVERLVLASPGLGGYMPRERPAFFQPLIAAFQAGDLDRAAVLLADSPMMAVPSKDSAWVRAMVLDNTRIFRLPPTIEHQRVPPAITRLESIGAPTLIITGSDDMADIRHAADTLATRIPGARALTIPGATHLVNLVAPERFTAAVLDFLMAPGSNR